MWIPKWLLVNLSPSLFCKLQELIDGPLIVAMATTVLRGLSEPGRGSNKKEVMTTYHLWILYSFRVYFI